MWDYHGEIATLIIRTNQGTTILAEDRFECPNIVKVDALEFPFLAH